MEDINEIVFFFGTMHSKDEYCRESRDELAEGQFSDQIQESHVVIQQE